MTIVEQTPAEEQQVSMGETGAGHGSSPKEKKSVLKKVTEKAKDKMKRIGSKLKPKGHDGGDKAGELVDRTPVDDDGEELEELLPGDSTSRDLDVPLDEFALIKQKESEKRDDEASAKGGLGDNLTEGLSSQSIAEQEPSAEDAPEALQAVPTEYHYKEEEGSPAKDENFSSEPKEEDASGSVAAKGGNDPGEATDEPVPVESESETGIQTDDRSSPEEDLSLKTQGQVGDTPGEKPETPARAQAGDVPHEKPETPPASPEEGNVQVGDTLEEKSTSSEAQESKDASTSPEAQESKDDGPKISDKDIEALSSSNLYTGEPDVKVNNEVEDDGGDGLVSPKPEEQDEELKDNVPSADTKLQEETSANAENLDDAKGTEAGSGDSPADTHDESGKDEKLASDQVEDRTLDGDETFADAKPDVDSTDAAGDAPELAGNDSGAAEGDIGGAESKLTEKSEVSGEPEILGKESAKVPTLFEGSSNPAEEEQNPGPSVKAPEKDIDDASTETQAPSDSGEALEKSLGDDAAKKSDAEIKEERKGAADGNPQANGVEDEKAPSKLDEAAPASENSGVSQKFMQNIASKLGYGTSATEQKNE